MKFILQPTEKIKLRSTDILESLRRRPATSRSLAKEFGVDVIRMMKFLGKVQKVDRRIRSEWVTVGDGKGDRCQELLFRVKEVE